MEAHDLGVLATRLSRQRLTPIGTPSKAGAFASTPFSKVATFNHGGVFVGRFTGQTPWERHRHGDELVHVLLGEVDLTLLTKRGPTTATLRAGSFVVVPRGAWHRQRARTEVTLLSATPTPTDTSFADDPRPGKRGGQLREPARSRSPRGRSARGQSGSSTASSKGRNRGRRTARDRAALVQRG